MTLGLVTTTNLAWELDIRSIKQTLGMDVLSCKTPEMLKREIWVHLLGYNMVRQVQVQTALAQKVCVRGN